MDALPDVIDNTSSVAVSPPHVVKLLRETFDEEMMRRHIGRLLRSEELANHPATGWRPAGLSGAKGRPQLKADRNSEDAQ